MTEWYRMQQPSAFAAIEAHLERNDGRKADVTATRLLRQLTSSGQIARAKFLRAKARILLNLPESALDDLNDLQNDLVLDGHDVLLTEMRADALFMRFELAQVGFADRRDLLEARCLYRRILDETPDYDNTGWVSYQLGRVLSALGHSRKAEARIRNALFLPSLLRPLTAYCYERLGYIAYYERQCADEAIVYLQKALQTYHESDVLLWRVRIHLLMSQVTRISNPDYSVENAESAYRLVVAPGMKRNRLYMDVLFHLGELYSQNQSTLHLSNSILHELIQTSRLPLGVDVTWSRIYELLGHNYYQQNQYAQSISAYETTLRYNPDHPWAENIYLNTAHALVALDKLDEARLLIQQHLQGGAVDSDSRRQADQMLHTIAQSRQYVN